MERTSSEPDRITFILKTIIIGSADSPNQRNETAPLAPKARESPDQIAKINAEPDGELPDLGCGPRDQRLHRGHRDGLPGPAGRVQLPDRRRVCEIRQRPRG